MPAWQIVLIVAALVAAAVVVAAALRLWRDPHALVRAEFARERMALGFARRVVEIDGIRWVYAEGGSRDADAPVLVMLRSEEHTSELQSLMRISYAVFCLKKKKIENKVVTVTTQQPATHTTTP